MVGLGSAPGGAKKRYKVWRLTCPTANVTRPFPTNEASRRMPEIQPAETTPSMGIDGGKYVYCIVRSDRQRDFGAIGIGGGQRVFTVAFQDLAAVVSDTPIVIYDPTRDNVLAHEFVNETVMKEFTVIPMSFGTVFRSEDDVTEL